MIAASWIGLAKADLDTPALLLDLPLLEQNIATMRDLAAQAGVACRPHTKTHKSPLIAHMQLAAGAAGICCAKLGEAEVMAASGVADILITTELVGRQKLARLMGVARRARVTVVVDDAGAADALASAASTAGIRLDVLVDVDVGQGRCGVPPGGAAVALAQRVARSGSLVFRGLQGYHGGAQLISGFGRRQPESQAALSRLLETAELARRQGLACEVLSGGGTGTAAIDARIGSLTELQPGSYVFMDTRYAAIEWSAAGEAPPFARALTLLGTVLSRPAPDRAVVDIGLKAASCDHGPIVPVDLPAARFEFAGDEHGILRFDGGRCPLWVGDRVEFHPSHCDTTVNLYDHLFVLRGGRVEEIWPIAARGCTQ